MSDPTPSDFAEKDDHLVEQRVAGECVYHGRLLKVHVDQVRLPNGRHSTREWLRHPGAVFILALTHNRELLMVRQYRYPVGQVLLELPAGKLDPGEDPAACAVRELEEETGWRASRITRIQTILPCVGYSDEELHFFVAEELQPGPPRPDEDEFIDCITVPLAHAYQMLMKGEFCDSKSAFAIAWLFAREGRPEGV